MILFGCIEIYFSLIINPRYDIPLSLSVIWVLFVLTFNFSSCSNILVAISLYLPASLFDFAKIKISSAYLTILIFSLFILWSNLSIYMFMSNGDITPPCGLPIVVSENAPSSNIPLSRKFLISFNTFPSLIFSLTESIIISWFSVSKHLDRSISTTYCSPQWFAKLSAFATAIWQERFGLYP